MNFEKSIENLYEYMVEKGYANKSGGGIVHRDTAVGRMYYVPTSATIRYKAENLVKRINPTDKDDPCAGLIRSLIDKPNVNTIVHSHSISDISLRAHTGSLTFQNFDLIKVFTTGQSIPLQILAQFSDFSQLIDSGDFNEESAVLLSGHGLYVWGNHLNPVFNKFEAYQTLIEVFVKTGRTIP